MRGNADTLELIAPGNLHAVLQQLADAPGTWTPVAGGTELMVAHAAGRLTAQKLISLWGIPDLAQIQSSLHYLTLGGGVTFGEIRRNLQIAQEFPLLTRAASWIGAIANQNRATLAGNIVNGSPAADAPPALLVYDAQIELISVRGRRRMPYADFHLGYKKSVLKSDELVLAIHLPLGHPRDVQYLRKVGTRRAMAITKVALAAIVKLRGGRIDEVRLAAASVADRPVRLLQTEAILLGRQPSAELREAARSMLLQEIQPIDDIRSTANYRRHVAGNLLDEFLVEVEHAAENGAGS